MDEFRLNIAMDGEHYATVHFQPGIERARAMSRARNITDAIKRHGGSETFTTELTVWNSSGRVVDGWQ